MFTATSLLTARLSTIGARLIGLLQVLLQSVLQAANLMHQTLLELVLVHHLRLLQTSVLLLLALRCFGPGWLTGPLSAHHFLLFLQVLERLVRLVVCSIVRFYLLDKVGQTRD